MASYVILNSTNAVSQNTFRTELPNSTDLSQYEVGLGNCQIYFSWTNINQSPLNNNSYTLTIPTSTTPATLQITIPDGSYNISDLNNQLQYELIQNGYYIYNSTTLVNRFYCAFELNPTSYKVDFICYPLPTSLPSGFTSGGMTFPGSANKVYQLTVSSSNNFGELIGFSPGTYPSSDTSATVITITSNLVPNVSPVSAVQMRLNCINNELGANNQLLHVFTTNNQQFGALIDASPNEITFVSCQGSHKELTVQFYDQIGRVLNLLDPNLVIKLVFRRKKNN